MFLAGAVRGSLKNALFQNVPPPTQRGIGAKFTLNWSKNMNQVSFGGSERMVTEPSIMTLHVGIAK